MKRFSGGDDTLDILELRAADRLAPRPEVPRRLVEVPEPDEPGLTRDFELTDRRINGKLMDMNRIDFTADGGATELWRAYNADQAPHNFHVHGLSFQVRSVGGAPPPPHLRGWKDTVYLSPHTWYELVVPLPEHTDPDTPYMYHCHLVYHEDQGMMGQFVVVGPGESAGEIDGSHMGHAGHMGH